MLVSVACLCADARLVKIYPCKTCSPDGSQLFSTSSNTTITIGYICEHDDRRPEARQFIYICDSSIDSANLFLDINVSCLTKGPPMKYSGHMALPAVSYAKRSILAALLVLFSLQFAATAGVDETDFIKENDVAMKAMMAGMDVKPTGDVDHDFAEMMIPHHQGAIDMAQAELRYGHNEQMRRIAQEIIVEQQQEIAAMRLALHQPLPPSVPSPDQFK